MDIEVEVRGKKSVVRNVPETTWDALRPFWPSIARAIIEVFVEGGFKPYSVRKNRKDGFFASEWYWEHSSVSPEKYPLKEARRFIKDILEKKEFVDSIREFNESRLVDWISNRNRNEKQLRRFIYNSCFFLEKFLRSLEII